MQEMNLARVRIPGGKESEPGLRAWSVRRGLRPREKGAALGTSYQGLYAGKASMMQEAI